MNVWVIKSQDKGYYKDFQYFSPFGPVWVPLSTGNALSHALYFKSKAAAELTLDFIRDYQSDCDIIMVDVDNPLVIDNSSLDGWF